MEKSLYEQWVAQWTPNHPGKTPPTAAQFSAILDLLDLDPEDIGMEDAN